MHKVKSDWLVLSSENTGQNIFRINFPNKCFSEVEFTTDASFTVNPTLPGTSSISLNAIDQFGGFSINKATVTVSNSVSPDLDWNFSNFCSGNNSYFYSSNQSANIVSYQWNFGDNSTATSSNPAHVYT